MLLLKVECTLHFIEELSKRVFLRNNHFTFERRVRHVFFHQPVSDWAIQSADLCGQSGNDVVQYHGKYVIS